MHTKYFREQNHPQEAVNLLKDVFAIKEHTQGKYNLSVHTQSKFMFNQFFHQTLINSSTLTTYARWLQH